MVSADIGKLHRAGGAGCAQEVGMYIYTVSGCRFANAEFLHKMLEWMTAVLQVMVGNLMTRGNAELAAELVRANVDVIVATGEPAIQSAKQATSTIAIVMGAVGEASRGRGPGLHCLQSTLACPR
jgi:hypothetical protein